jgi:hypothetical protein
MHTGTHSVGVRLQGFDFPSQALVLARFSQARSGDGQFTPRALEQQFDDLSLPRPKNISDVIGKLKGKGLLTKGSRPSCWKITPWGRDESVRLMSDIDLVALSAEAATTSSFLGHVEHTIVPPTLAPPHLVAGLRKFLEEHPFERNVFGMTRFPENDNGSDALDPVRRALDIARQACSLHGLEFHLASDRAIDDDLWANVAAHMWACRYGMAFFEDRTKAGLNYNLTIEVGSMLMAGRRCGLLKDISIKKMPTDLVGRIYKDVDLGKLQTVTSAIHEWLCDDLGLGRCSECPRNR